MKKYINFILSRPVSVLAAIAVITILLALGIPKLKFDHSIDVMMPKNDSQYLYYENMKKVYGNIGKFVIMSVTGKDIWTNKFFADMDDLVTDLEEYNEFNEERETNRLKKLKRITETDSINISSLLESFKNDPPFQREITRTASRHFSKQTELDSSAIKKLRNEIQQFYNIKKQESIDVIISPLNAKDITGRNDTLETIEMIETDDQGNRILPKTERDFDTFKKKLTKNPAFEKVLYAKNLKNNKITDFGILVKLVNSKNMDTIARRIWDISKSFRDISVTLQGVPIVNKFMNDYMRDDLYNFLPIVILVVLIVFFLNFRSIRGVILPFFTLILADIWLLGFMGHLGFNLTIIGVSLPSLMVAVGSSYSIHILNQYYIDFNLIEKYGKKNGLMLSMTHISITVLLAGLTTFIGFNSLVSNQITGIREWGFLSAVGVLFAVLISTTVIPAGNMLMPHKNAYKKGKKVNPDHKNRWIEPVIRLFIKISTEYYRAVLFAVVIIIVISLIGITKIKVETSFLEYFKKNDYVRKSSIILGKKFGGSFGLSILIDSGEENGIKDPEFLRLIDEIRDWLESNKNKDLYVGKTDAFSQVIKSMHMAMNNDDPEFYKIPDERETIEEYMEIYSGDDDDFDGRADEFEPFVDPDFRTALIFTKIWGKGEKTLGTESLKYIRDKISDYLGAKLHGRYSFKLTGEPSIIIRLSKYVVQGQLLSLLFSMLAVGLIVILLFKNWIAGFVSLIPMSLAVIINFGIMGWFGIRLDTATAIIASITIGIGVDDTIHFLNTFRHFRSKNLSVSETISKTLTISGRAITFTSFALIFGFSVLIVSNFMPIILFGILVAITMTATTFGALIVLPSVIKAGGLTLDENKSKSLFWRIFYIGKFFNIE